MLYKCKKSLSDSFLRLVNFYSTTMNTPTIISINPIVKTIGQIHQESISRESAIPRIVSNLSVTPRLKDTLNLLTGINTPAMSGASGRILLLRFISAAAIITVSALLFATGGEMLLSIPLAVLGISLLLGLMTRIISLTAMIYFILAGVQGMLPLEPCCIFGFSALIFMIMGPGIYSIDQCIRKAIWRSYKRRAKRAALRASTSSRLRNNGIDYRTYLRL